MAPADPPRFAPVHLSLIAKKEVPPQDAQRVLIAAFTAKDYLDSIKNLNGCNIDPQTYIDGLDQASSRLPILTRNTLTAVPSQIIDTLPQGSEIYHRALRALRKACGIYGILPSSHLISEGLTLITVGRMKRPFASGGFSDVWKARNNADHFFAIKQLRVYMVDDLARMKKARTSDQLPILSSFLTSLPEILQRGHHL